jgi:hypothetical protein
LLSKKLAKTEAQETSGDTPQIQETAGKYLPAKNLVFEQIEGGKFFCSNGKLVNQIIDVVNGQEIVYAPIPYESASWHLCNDTPIKPVDKKKLWSFVKRFIYDNVELPDERQYDVLTAWVFATWIPELWNVSPYVFFVGIKNTGKTHALEVLQLICFRAKISVASTAPALFRSIEKYGCIPFIDESETLSQDAAVDIVACLNAGYKRSSAMVERCQGDGSNQDIVTFHIFGFKGIAGTKKLIATLESRSIVFNMAKNTRRLNVIVNENAAKKIRNGLLQWRFETLLNNSVSTNTIQEVDNNDTYDAYDTYDACDSKTRTIPNLPEDFLAIENGRVIELFTPLYVVADEETKQYIVEYAKAVTTHQKTEENTSIDSEILLAILECHDLVEKGLVPRTAIENVYNKDRPEKERLYGETITNRITTLGLEKGRTSKQRGFIWNSKKLIALCERFGFDPTSYQLKDDVSPLLLVSQPSQVSYASQPSQTENKPEQPEPSQAGRFASADLDTVASCTALDKADRQVNMPCQICSKPSDLLYAIQFFNGEKGEICMSCGSRILEHLQHTQEMETAQ